MGNIFLLFGDSCQGRDLFGFLLKLPNEFIRFEMESDWRQMM